MAALARSTALRAARPAAALLVLLAAAAALASPTAAENAAPAPLRLTLAEAIQRARKASPKLDELRSLVAAGKAGERGALAARWPDLDVTAGYTRQSHVPELGFPEPDGSYRVIFPDIPDRWSGRVGVSVPLYTGGALSAGAAVAGDRRQAAEHDLESAGHDLVLEVTGAYLDLAVARRRERVLADSIAAFQAHLTDVENRKRFGLAAANDVLAVTVQRDRAKLARLEAANAAAVAEADLARLLDLPPGQEVALADSLEAPAPAAPEPLDRLVDEALAGRSEVAALRARIDAATATEGVAGAALRPRLSARAGWDYARPNPRILPLADTFNDSWDVSLAVSWRLFDGGQRAAAVSEARARTAAARHRLEELERAIRLEVTARVHDLDTARAALDVTGTNVTAAEEARRVAGDRFRAGLIPSSELLDAENAELAAGLDRAAASAAVLRARAGLDHAVGR